MNYAYTYTYTPLFSMILPILALLLILAGGIALYTLFVRKPNHYHGAAAKRGKRAGKADLLPVIQALLARGAAIKLRYSDCFHSLAGSSSSALGGVSLGRRAR